MLPDFYEMYQLYLFHYVEIFLALLKFFGHASHFE